MRFGPLGEYCLHEMEDILKSYNLTCNYLVMTFIHITQVSRPLLVWIMEFKNNRM